MKSILMIVCLSVLFLSIAPGLVSGEGAMSNNTRIYSAMESSVSANYSQTDLTTQKISRDLCVMKSPQVTTKIVDDSGKAVETIDRVAVLKRGEHYFDNTAQRWRGFGWGHISLPRGELQSHADDIKDAFDLANNDKAVKDFIAEGLEKGYVNPDRPIEIIYEPKGFGKKLQIVLSPYYLGSITTAHPI